MARLNVTRVVLLSSFVALMGCDAFDETIYYCGTDDDCIEGFRCWVSPEAGHGAWCVAEEQIGAITCDVNCAEEDMVRIPDEADSVTYTRGCPDTEDWCPGSKTEAEITLDAFLIDRVEVTVGDYKRCVDDGACPKTSTSSSLCNFTSDVDDLPINCVNWYEASAYCLWAKKRLPTQDEWELAAKGPTHRRFVWGDDCPASWSENFCEGPEWTPSTALANCEEALCNDGFDDTSPVDEMSGDVSVYGVVGLTGNVSEWTDWAGASGDTGRINEDVGPAVRGSYFYDISPLSDRFYWNPVNWAAGVGFRCADDSL